MMAVCRMCGREFVARDRRKKYCLDCAARRKVLADAAYDRGKTLEQMIEEEKKKMEQAQTPPQQIVTGIQRKAWFSARYTIVQLDKLAKKYHTSYGKLVAWIDSRDRLPEAGEEVV
jgi:hypothetical protein